MPISDIQAHTAEQHRRNADPVRFVVQLDVVHGDQGHPGILLPACAARQPPPG
jgi:hypothetical protein